LLNYPNTIIIKLTPAPASGRLACTYCHGQAVTTHCECAFSCFIQN